MCTQMIILGFPGSSVVKNLPAVQEIWIQYLGREDPLQEEMAPRSGNLAWEMLWTEEPGKLHTVLLLLLLSRFSHVQLCVNP